MATERELRLHRVIFATPTRRQRDLSRRIVEGEVETEAELPGHSAIDLHDRQHEIIAQQAAPLIAAEDAAIALSADNEVAYLAAIDAALAELADDTEGDSVASVIALLEAAGGTSPEPE